MNLKKKVPNREIYIEYVKILNGVLQLSNRESEVFSFLLQADLQFPGNINSKALRNILLKQLGISDANLSKYLRVIKNKGLIVRGLDRKWILNPNIRPEIKLAKEDELNDFIEVIITLELKEDKEDGINRMDNQYSKTSELEG